MFDVITMGSATIDVFLDTGTKLFGTHKQGKITVPFGSKIIVDKIRFETGGGGTNTAISFSRMGLKTAFIGNISSNPQADFLLKELKKDNVSTSFVICKGDMSGYSAILDAKGHDRTILAYKGSNNLISSKDIKFRKIKTRWIYMTSMMGESFRAAEKVAEYAGSKGIKLMFNPSSYLVKKGVRYLSKILKNCTILVYNKEEATILVGKGDMKKLLKKSYALGPSVVIITDGPRGAYTYDGEEMHYIKANKAKIVETTGAGDSFGSGFLTGYIKTGDVDKSLCIAQANAESVITHFGAKNKLLTWKEALSRIKLGNVKRSLL